MQEQQLQQECALKLPRKNKMPQELNPLERKDGWTEIRGGLISRERLEGWVQEYFGREEDLSDFKRRNKGNYLELLSPEGGRGYLFFGELQLDRDYEARMSGEREKSEFIGRKTINVFVDNKKGLSGFYWESPTIN